MAWLVSDARVLASAEVAADGSARRRGLLGRDQFDGALAIDRCRWVHTIGMRFPIDVAYVDGEGIVVKTTQMKRHRIGLPARGAQMVIEAEAGAFARWELRVGDEVELRFDETDAPQPDAPLPDTLRPDTGRPDTRRPDTPESGAD